MTTMMMMIDYRGIKKNWTNKKSKQKSDSIEYILTHFKLTIY